MVIYQNNIKDDLIAQVLISLENSPIEVLDVSDNYIREISIEKLGQVLRSKSLKILKISDCSIEPDISETFQEILKLQNFTTIEWLAYNYNEVSDPVDFIKIIKDSLKGLKKLSIKDIVDEDDREHIKELLKDQSIEFESDYEEDDLRDLE